MKYYTYQEHHIFCIKSGIPNGEVWKQVVKLGWLPDGIYHKPDLAFNPKYKAYQKEYDKRRYENRANRKTPEYKAKKKEYDKRRRSKK